jgi:hypothetical protein
MVHVDQKSDTLFDTKLAMKNVQTAIADLARMQMARLMVANVAVILRNKIQPQENKPLTFKEHNNTAKAIIKQCDVEADTICAAIGVSTEIHKCVVSTIILSDYIGELYNDLYDAHKNEDNEDKIYTEMQNQLKNINTGGVCLLNGPISPYLFGNRLLIKCMNFTKIAVLQKSEASYPRGGRNTEEPQNESAHDPKPTIDGSTALASVRSIKTDIYSKSNEGHQWSVTALYEIRSRVLLPIKKFVMNEQVFEHFDWLNDYSFFTTNGTTNTGLYPSTQEHSVSINPNITTLLNIAVNIPFLPHPSAYQVLQTLPKNTLPAIAQH